MTKKTRLQMVEVLVGCLEDSLIIAQQELFQKQLKSIAGNFALLENISLRENHKSPRNVSKSCNFKMATVCNKPKLVM